MWGKESADTILPHTQINIDFMGPGPAKEEVSPQMKSDTEQKVHFYRTIKISLPALVQISYMLCTFSAVRHLELSDF